jgi:hypothetical protein
MYIFHFYLLVNWPPEALFFLIWTCMAWQYIYVLGKVQALPIFFNNEKRNKMKMKIRQQTFYESEVWHKFPVKLFAMVNYYWLITFFVISWSRSSFFFCCFSRFAVSPVMAFVMGSESPELWLKINGGKKFQTLRTYMLEHNDLNQAIFLQCTCLEARVVLGFFLKSQ